ncbi:TetR/AcrR family transcriptional regulator [Amycolatopsis alkalitolerans]|uniref:TetR/AcrR family transcriptional regulator n=1 Tax=Amycolatopsis alkalitolerans TaxID=2547244 RepID=A0A5C4M8K5_9PSEU|nr:TetR/AcrR family transcriptional regulator [Amycolatopsis alkalitolerans]
MGPPCPSFGEQGYELAAPGGGPFAQSSGRIAHRPASGLRSVRANVAYDQSRRVRFVVTGGASRRQLVENELLDRAAALFAERGFEGTTLKDIAEAIGITRPSLYHYIKSKDDLLGMLVAGLTETAAAELAEMEASDLSWSERLSRAVRSVTLRICAHPSRFRLLDRSEHILPESFQRRHQAGKREILTHLSAIIDGGVKSGEFWPTDVRVAAFSILGSCNWVAWWFRPDARGADPQAVADQLAVMALRSVARTDRASSPAGPRAALAAIRADLEYVERHLPAEDSSS